MKEEEWQVSSVVTIMHGQLPLTFSLVVLVNIMGDTQANVTQAFPMHWYLLDLDTVRMLKALNGFSINKSYNSLKKGT